MTKRDSGIFARGMTTDGDVTQDGMPTFGPSSVKALNRWTRTMVTGTLANWTL